MEFRITSQPLFRSEVVKISNNLLPSGFSGDRRAAVDATSKVAEIINEIGEASARAQGLSKPVTTAQKLRNSEHIVYLLTEKPVKSGTVVVTGLIKVGHKSLYIFDANGETQMVHAPCLLDFYVHESKQRCGLGKILYEYMLEQEHLKPDHLAIDRPSEKLIGFLKKHYSLTDTIPQMNNFVVYEGFFHNKMNQNGRVRNESRIHLTSSPNTTLFGPQYVADERRSRPHETVLPQIPMIQTTPVGRYAAPRPTCSMAQIIHNNPTATASNEAQRIPFHYNEHIDDDMITDLIAETEDLVNHAVITNDDDEHPHQTQERKKNVSKVNFQLSENAITNKSARNINLPSPPSLMSTNQDPRQFPSPCAYHTEICNSSDDVNQQPSQLSSPTQLQRALLDPNNFLQLRYLPPPPERPNKFPNTLNPPFRLNKMHTGLKNVSFNVGAAVSPTAKMEFYQEKPEEFGVGKITQPIGTTCRPPGEHGPYDKFSINTMSPNTNKNCLTDQGFFDLKFYHNKLW